VSVRRLAKHGRISAAQRSQKLLNVIRSGTS
jgi:hypothetical protein